MTTNIFIHRLGDIVVVIVTNPMFILPWVHRKFAVKFTISNFDEHIIYMHICCLNCPEMAHANSSDDREMPCV